MLFRSGLNVKILKVFPTSIVLTTYIAHLNVLNHENFSLQEDMNCADSSCSGGSRKLETGILAYCMGNGTSTVGCSCQITSFKYSTAGRDGVAILHDICDHLNRCS